jgi:inner membrane protein
MVFFGHVGLAAAAARFIEKRTAARIDYRVVILGSMFPDIIDKPLFMLFSGVPSGRFAAHTLLFAAVLLGVGAYRHMRGWGTGALAFGGAVLVHDLLDSMWVYPRTFFWPLLGLGFEPTKDADWLAGVAYNFFNDPAVYVPEAAGACIVAYMGLRAWRRGLGGFLRTGRYG